MKFLSIYTKYVLFFLFILTFSTSILASTPQLIIEPSRFELLVRPREKSIQAVKVTNCGQEPLTLIAATRDWGMNDSGGLVLNEPVSIRESASGWLRFNPGRFTIPPGETQYIRFAVSVPPGVEAGEYRTGLVLTTEDRYKMEEEFYFQPSFALLVYVNVPVIEREGDIENIKYYSDDKGNDCLEGDIYSLGNAHVRLTGEYFIEDKDKRIVKNGLIGKMVILSGHKQSFKINLDDELQPGKYRANITWQYLSAYYMEGSLDEYPEGEKELVEDLSFTVK